MISIDLANGRGTAFVDDEDFGLVGRLPWWFLDGYCATSVRLNGKPVNTLMHCLLMKVPSGFQVDHVDGNGLNNRRSNLRIVTVQQNQQNKSVLVTNKSGFKGVHLNKATGLWRAQIHHNGRKYSLGYFKEVADAGRAYDAKARELFGEFARFNFPKDGERAAR